MPDNLHPESCFVNPLHLIFACLIACTLSHTFVHELQLTSASLITCPSDLSIVSNHAQSEHG